MDTENNIPDGFVRINARDLYREIVTDDLVFNNLGWRGIVDHLEEQSSYFVAFFNDVFGYPHSIIMHKELDFFQLPGKKENLLIYRDSKKEMTEFNMFIHKK